MISDNFWPHVHNYRWKAETTSIYTPTVWENIVADTVKSKPHICIAYEKFQNVAYIVLSLFQQKKRSYCLNIYIYIYIEDGAKPKRHSVDSRRHKWQSYMENKLKHNINVCNITLGKIKFLLKINAEWYID